MGTKLTQTCTQMHLHGEVAELHPFALNTVAICWPATQERIDKALVFLAHPGNWLAGPQTPFSITHNLTVGDPLYVPSCPPGGSSRFRALGYKPSKTVWRGPRRLAGRLLAPPGVSV